MSPAQALQMQIEAYRRMRGEERLAIALRLHDLACNISREGIRSQFPNVTDEEIEDQLRRRIHLAHRA